MKIYVLIPLYRSTFVKVKERNYSIPRSELTPDYSKHFGVKNEYYLDLAHQVYEVSGRKDAKYERNGNVWHYSALNPCDVIKKRATK